MSDYRVASRYAKSIFELALDQKLEDKLKDDMALLDNVCSENRDFNNMLKSPIIKHNKKLHILQKTFKGKVNEVTLRFFDILCRKYRENLLPDIARVYVELYNENKGITVAELTTAIAVRDDVKKEFESLIKKATNKTPQITEKVDKDVIGGFMLKVEDRMIDDTIRGKLNALRRKFTESY
jgi:F-type H+-transporting ATPase subunit delta